MSLEDVKVGDELVLVRQVHRRDENVRTAKVTKVARKYLYVEPEYGREDVKIDIETGHEWYNHRTGNGSYLEHAYTIAGWETYKLSREAEEVIRSAGLDFRLGFSSGWSDQDKIDLAEWLVESGKVTV